MTSRGRIESPLREVFFDFLLNCTQYFDRNVVYYI